MKSVQERIPRAEKRAGQSCLKQRPKPRDFDLRYKNVLETYSRSEKSFTVAAEEKGRKKVDGRSCS